MFLQKMILPYIRDLHSILNQAFSGHFEHANLRTGYQQTIECIIYVSIQGVNKYTNALHTNMTYL